MKNIKIIFISLTAICFLITSCYKEPTPVYTTGIINPGTKTYNNSKILKDFSVKNETKYQVYNFNASNGGVITSKNGVKYYIPAYAFTTSSGAPVSGNITISIKEILKPSEMILSNKPTLANGGGILESFGEFLVKAEQNNQKLKLIVDTAQMQNAIRLAFRNPNKTPQYIPLWEGDTTITFSKSGYDYLNSLITKTYDIPIPKGVEWNQLFGKNANADPDTVRFVLPDLFKWVNCDVLNNYSGNAKTTILAYFENVFNSETTTDYTGKQPSMCFFKPDSKNTMVKLYNMIIDAPAGKEGFLSYQNSMPVGVSGTFFVMTVKDEKFYCQTKKMTIDAPLPGKNYTPISFQLNEVSEAELLNQINALNN